MIATWVYLLISLLVMFIGYVIGQLVGIYRFQKWSSHWMKEAIKLAIKELEVQKTIREIFSETKKSL